MRSASVVLMLCAPCVAFHLPAAAAIRPTRCIAPLIMKEGNSAGKGFGKLSVEEEAAARGREQLEALRAATSDRGYDSTLQGLQDKLKEPEATAEELEQFKSQITLGLAGFLILGGVLSLFIGGNLWEPKGFNEDGTPPVEETPAFGFAPKANVQPPPSDGAPSWADPPAPAAAPDPAAEVAAAPSPAATEEVATP